jgi:hypothetical protein
MKTLKSPLPSQEENAALRTTICQQKGFIWVLSGVLGILFALLLEYPQTTAISTRGESFSAAFILVALLGLAAGVRGVWLIIVTRVR